MSLTEVPEYVRAKVLAEPAEDVAVDPEDFGAKSPAAVESSEAADSGILNKDDDSEEIEDFLSYDDEEYVRDFHQQ